MVRSLTLLTTSEDFPDFPGRTRGLTGAIIFNNTFWTALRDYGRHTDRIVPFIQPFAANAPKSSTGNVQLTPMPLHRIGHEIGRLQTSIVWHEPGGPASMAKVVPLRNSYAPNVTLTGTLHSLQPTANWLTYVTRLTTPQDVLVAPSKAAASAFTSFCEAIRQHKLHEWDPPSIEVVPHGIDTCHFKPMDRVAARDSIGLPMDKTIVGYVGRLSQFTKMDVIPLLRAFQRATADRNDVVLVLAGADYVRYRSLLSDIIKKLRLRDKVIVRTKVEYPNDTVVYMNACDVFVSLSDYTGETFGLAPVEAMACGLPVVLADWGPYRDLIRDGIEGFLITTIGDYTSSLPRFYDAVDPAICSLYLSQRVAVDHNMLECRLRELLDNPELRRVLGDAARKRAGSHYPYARMICDYEDMWRSRATISSLDKWGPKQRTREVAQAQLLAQSLGGYATHSLHDSDEVYIRDLPGDGYAYDELAHSLMCAPTILEVLAEPHTLTALIRQVQEMSSCPDAEIRTSLLWLVKQGLVGVRETDFSHSAKVVRPQSLHPKDK